MANQTILPEATYTVTAVGPSANRSFNGDKGPVEFNVTSVQLEGHEDIWVEVNSASDKPTPKVGDTLEGHIEQDEAGKYLPKFKKKRGGGGGNWGGGGGNWGGGGGGQSSPGAIWAARVDTGAAIVAGYYAASGKKPKDMAEYLGKVKVVAGKVNDMVDTFVAADALVSKPEPAANSEAGESPAPAKQAAPAAPKKADVEIQDIDEDELGDF